MIKLMGRGQGTLTRHLAVSRFSQICNEVSQAEQERDSKLKQAKQEGAKIKDPESRAAFKTLVEALETERRLEKAEQELEDYQEEQREYARIEQF